MTTAARCPPHRYQLSASGSRYSTASCLDCEDKGSGRVFSNVFDEASAWKGKSKKGAAASKISQQASKR